MSATHGKLIAVYFFLLFIVGCASNLSPSYKIGDRVKVKSNDNEHIGVILEPFFNYLNKKYSYRVYCNGDYSWYNNENLEIADPMPSTLKELEEASWHDKNENIKTNKSQAKIN